ncbi:MAG: hypothetical protein EX266_06125 [Rhodobacteraceae bacterium]|nr:MAG: hypothetical protein EX266_06125 [Paracoccaceae bacterium]
MSQITAVFGWMLVINLAVYTLAAVLIVFARDFTTRLEARITGIPAKEWPRIFVDYLSRYKIAIMVFNLAPWVALKVVV